MKSSPAPALPDPAPAVGRAVALLRSLEAGPGSLDELTRTHGWPKPSLLRLLRSLERAGLVHRDQATRRWQALMRLVSCQGAELLLRARVAGSLPALAEAIGHTVELYRFAGTTMDLIERAESQTGGVAVRARIGFQRTFDEAEAVTLIAAAYAQAPSPRRRWRWTQRATGPERLLLDGRAFAALVAAARAQGVAWDAERNEWSVRRCAVPIRDGHGVLQGALAVALTGEARSDQAIEQRLRTATSTGRSAHRTLKDATP
jgi:DNA-binding IclR family transcriptional regulator